MLHYFSPIVLLRILLNWFSWIFTTQVDLKFEPVAFTIVETKGASEAGAGSANPVGDLYDYKSIIYTLYTGQVSSTSFRIH